MPEAGPLGDAVARRRAGRRAWLAAAGLGAAALAGEVLRPRRWLASVQPCPPLPLLLPDRVDGWVDDPRRSQPLVLPELRAVLETLYQQTLARSYHAAGDGLLMLAAAYGGDQSDATRTHRPEVCYPAQGFETGPTLRARIDLSAGRPGAAGLSVARLQARLGSRREAITYWMTVGDQAVTTSREQKWAQMGYGLRGWVPDGLLVRVSTLHANPARAWAVQDRFVQALAARLWRDRPQDWGRLFGGGGG